MNKLNRLFFSAILILALDFIYLNATKSIFESLVVKVQRVVMKVKIIPAILCYILLIFALNYFILRTKRSVLDAFLLGVVIYGVFDTTNLAILKKWDNKCGVTGSGLKEILISSHIVPWRDSNQDEKLDPDNGILLSPNLDGLFDRYLISFKDSGRIIISNRINTNDLNRLGIHENMKLSQVTDGMKSFLKRHRKIFNDKN